MNSTSEDLDSIQGFSSDSRRLLIQSLGGSGDSSSNWIPDTYLGDLD